jgi:molecular chaperone GrpE
MDKDESSNLEAVAGEPSLLTDEDSLTVAQTETQLLQQQIEQLNDQLLRTQAEVQNMRRRAEEDLTKARKFSIEAFAESLFPVADSLEAGLAIHDATTAQIQEGAQATLRQLRAAFERHKLVTIAPDAGDPFDPHQHQAISVVPSPGDTEQGPNTIVSVLQKGYCIADRVLRPALVTVTASS